MDIDVPLSPHFTLQEMIATEHRKLDNVPHEEGIVSHLTWVAVKLLEPIRARFGPLHINSGYRSQAVNEAVGGNPESAHVFGCAADFMPYDRKVTTKEIVNWVRESELQFDQVLEEIYPTKRWVHLGKIRPGYQALPRLEVLTILNGKPVDYSPR